MKDQEAVNNQNGGRRPPDHVIHGNCVRGEIKAFEPAWGDPRWVYVVYVEVENKDDRPIQDLVSEVMKVIQETEDWIEDHASRHGGPRYCRLFLCWG